MRLHRLSVTAFGPFADTADVDFDELGADGLFLLHGHTGAGKTTVLDAIAFALYGTVPGARREAKRLRSDHAPADVVPKVVLDATIGGRRLRLTRSPDYSRPKKRGVGMRSEPAKATLTWLDGRGQNLTRLVDIGDEVNRLLGMSADQFFQVVLLPQGEFARFLRADNDDRETLLERLFDTERFGDAEAWLAERRRESAASLATHSESIERLAAQVCTAAGVERAIADVETGDTVDWAQDLLESARAVKSTAETELETRAAAATTAGARLDDDRRVAELHRRAHAAEEQLEAYRQSGERRDAIGKEFDAAAKARPVAKVAAEAKTVRQQADRALDVASAARAAVADLGGSALVDAVSWPPSDGDTATIDEAVRAWTVEVGKLDDAIADIGALAAAQQERKRLDREHRKVATAVANAATARDGVPVRLRANEDEWRDAVASAARLPGLEIERAAVAEAAAAAVELRKKRTALTRAESAFETCRAAHTDTRERVLDLRERRLAGMAAELATDLTDGTPCQVCGSTSHPDVASPADDSVTRADEAAATAAEERAADDTDRARAAVTAVEREIDELIARGGDRDQKTLVAELNDVTTRFEVAIAARARAEQLTTENEALRAEDARLADEVRVAETRLAGTVERLAAVKDRTAQLEARVASVATAEEPTVRRARIDRLTRATIALRDSRSAAGTAAERAQTAEKALQLAIAEGGFADVDTALAAVRSPERLSTIENELAEAHEIRVRATAVLADPDIVAVRDRSTDVPAREADAQAASQSLNVAVAVHAEAVRRAAQLEELVTQLWAAAERLEPMRARHDELSGVADLVAGRGQNSRRMSLRSYVLAARLEEVAAAGTARLARMTSGRYEFVHSDAQGPRGKRGGLGLDIRDDYTGTIRPAKSLSGGETFVASLALALGLADVVASESGGVVLDTMFIDEGFGSLDNDLLDSVMGILDELRAGGRVVGIVSHVDEMRQRIPSRLHVIRGRSGSRLETLSAV